MLIFYGIRNSEAGIDTRPVFQPVEHRPARMMIFPLLKNLRHLKNSSGQHQVSPPGEL